MSKLKIPSLQHLARNWHESPESVEKSLILLVDNTPNFNYNCLNDAVRDILVYGVEYEELASGISLGEKRENVRRILLEVLDLVYGHFSSIKPDFVHAIAPQNYRLSSEYSVPFKPPLVYGLGGQLYFPWLSFWKRNPLAGERLSLFVTLVEQMLREDPDLETAKFQIIDCSAVDSKEPRSLTIIDSSDVPSLDKLRTTQMLETFVDGFKRAEVTLSRRGEAKVTRRDRDTVYADPDQLKLWS